MTFLKRTINILPKSKMATHVFFYLKDNYTNYQMQRNTATAGGLFHFILTATIDHTASF